MSILKPAFLKEPFTIVRGRYHEIDLLFYESYNKKTGTGTLRDLEAEGMSFICDFKYDLDDPSAIFTIEGPSSPQGIIVDYGKVTLILDQTNTELIISPTDNNIDFPLVRVYFELKAIDTSGRPMTAVMGICNVYQNGTRSDE